jgi:hydroxymethylglutaryl-CoA lyase
MDKLKLVECPRDAMQGLREFIPTELKVRYINQLLKVGFDTIDLGSFVSPKAIPQMADTAEVLKQLDFSKTSSKALVIIANARGARDAVSFPQVDYLGFPFSVSETFQMRNTNSTLAESFERVKEIQDICYTHDKKMVVYLSMGFGNPYGDEWNAEICMSWMDKIAELGIGVVALSDTIGVATPDSISYLFSNMIPEFPDVEIGAHFHTQAHNWREKAHAAFENGCRRFDSAIKGFGGCPMAKDGLTGNMPTENLISYFNHHKIDTHINLDAFIEAMQVANEVFPK